MRLIDTATGLPMCALTGNRSEKHCSSLAWHDTRNNNDPKLANLEAEAAKRGLWADDNPVPAVRPPSKTACGQVALTPFR